jgi:hypothetical protein
MRMRLAAALLALLGLLPATASDLVGREVPPYPDGLVSRQGICVSDMQGYEHVCDYGWAIVEDAEGHPRYLVAGQSIGHDANGPRWRVLDAIPHPDMAGDEYLALGTCRLRGIPDAEPVPAIVAVVGVGGDVEWFDDVRRAWRLDFARKRLVEAPVAGLECANEGYNL